MTISNELKKILASTVEEINKKNPPKTLEDKNKNYDKAMSWVKNNSPSSFSITNPIDQLAFKLAR